MQKRPESGEQGERKEREESVLYAQGPQLTDKVGEQKQKSAKGTMSELQVLILQSLLEKIPCLVLGAAPHVFDLVLGQKDLLAESQRCTRACAGSRE